MTDYVVLAAAMLLTGGIGGVLAGLLGIGGGIVIVPVMEAALAFLGVDPAIRMHIAVATSLATIIPTSISSARAHHRRQAVDTELAKRWAVFILVGALAGSVFATQVHSRVLSAVFAVTALVIAIKLILPLDGRTIAREVPRGLSIHLVPTGIGAVSSMMGIGGGTLSVVTLTLFNLPIHRAVGTAALFGLFISIPGTMGYILGGLGDPRLPPGSFGYVSVIGFLLIAPTTWLTAPLGAAIAHRLSPRQLGMLFGAFLLLVSLRMFWQSI